jgi:hypothetical protein
MTPRPSVVPSRRRAARPRRALLALLAAAAVLAGGVLLACGGTGTASGGTLPSPSATGTAGSQGGSPAASPSPKGPLVDPALKVGEWRHAWQVVGLLRARTPRLPVVFYFGDSTARESLVSDAAWARQLRALGVDARTFTLASHDQTFRMDRRFVDEMPKLRGLALIGVGLSRFVGPPVRGPFGRPAVFKAGHEPQLGHWTRHYYDDRPPKSAAAKAARVTHWEGSRAGKFRKYRAANLRSLAQLVKACRKRGLRPVLLQLPVNLQVVGGRLAAERRALSRGVRNLARREHVRFLDFPVTPDLTSADFYDINHLLHSGAAKWQRSLSRWTARLLPTAGG